MGISYFLQPLSASSNKEPLEASGSSLVLNKVNKKPTIWPCNPTCWSNKNYLCLFLFNEIETYSKQSEYGMSEDEYKMRNIVDKLIEKTSVLSMLGIVPAMMLSGGGAAVAAGVTALLSYMLRDAAWYKKKDYSGQTPGSGLKGDGIYHKAADKARSER